MSSYELATEANWYDRHNISSPAPVAPSPREEREPESEQTEESEPLDWEKM